uniref:Uncharacterized protein n=1 Tax=Nelumbo nucifera TaxID=4432 RepID=A0A822YKV6_NELNU|nr:TPA_asm: hypothetical protein HUJ06_010397 [Nelumbo nucifera]
MQGEISSFMLLFEGLTKNDSNAYVEDYDITLYCLNPLPYMDDMDEMDMGKMEEARSAYITAVAAAKEKQDEESIAIAARARLHLQSFVLKNKQLES